MYALSFLRLLRNACRHHILCQLMIVFHDSSITDVMGSSFYSTLSEVKTSRMLESSRDSVNLTINLYLDLVQHLFKVYATESAMIRAQATFYEMTQHHGEDVDLESVAGTSRSIGLLQNIIDM
jgi:hypothetical protein